MPRNYKPIPETIQPTKIHGVRRPQRDRVRSDKDPQTNPTNNETTDVTDVMVAKAAVGLPIPASLMCCGNRTVPLTPKAAELSIPYRVKAIKKRMVIALENGLPVSGDNSSGEKSP